ncbi:MAG: hypothetical protein Q4P66_07405 [Actinomycetaceae bacterium]|nr:hypothetical protein [Actinomycetaceae bacterium]
MSTLVFARNNKPRKQLATVIAQTTGATVEYEGTPSFAYRIGEAVLDRDWCLHLTETANPTVVLEAAKAAGFHTQPSTSEPASEVVGLTLVFPTTRWDKTTANKLKALLASKAPLLTKALNIEGVSMLVDEGEGVVKFPWFNQLPEPDVIEAVTYLLEALIAYAKRPRGCEQTYRECLTRSMRCVVGYYAWA